LFKASETTRTPAQILAHIGDLLDWALSIARGNETWNNSEPLVWNEEIDRFHTALKSFDDYLASDSELSASCERLFQGPIADALTHVGQIAMLRRVAGEPMKGENYSRAKIAAGQVGADQERPSVSSIDRLTIADLLSSVSISADSKRPNQLLSKARSVLCAQPG